VPISNFHLHQLALKRLRETSNHQLEEAPAIGLSATATTLTCVVLLTLLALLLAGWTYSAALAAVGGAGLVAVELRNRLM
jgi:hypothetical protein